MSEKQRRNILIAQKFPISCHFYKLTNDGTDLKLMNRRIAVNSDEQGIPFILSPSTAALSHSNPASTKTSYGSCSTQDI
jgi:hypothetical protein